MRTVSRCALALVSCLIAQIGTAGAVGRTYALLVGVSQYPNLDQALWLDGPRNDVQMYAAVLESRGVAKADISVLADGVPGAGDPTHKAILGALDAIAARVRPGDLAVLMFAGHGSQQPAMAEDLKKRGVILWTW